MMNPIKQFILPFFIIIASFTVIGIVVAEDKAELPHGANTTNEISTNSVNEIQKILEQTALIDKTLEIEAKEISDLFSSLEGIRGRKQEFESQSNVYKIELTTFGSQLHLSDV
jgi:hypothetical protein